jgi:hypothetical protein
LHVAGIDGGEMPGDDEALVIGGERAGIVVLCVLHVADLVEADRDVALQLGIALVLVGETAREGEALLIFGESALGVAASEELDVAHLVEADGDVALPRHVVRVGVGETARDGRLSS